MKLKKFLIISLVMTILLSSLPSLAISEVEQGFNQYGFRNGLKQESLERELLLETRALNSWEQMPSKSSVDLEKVWTVKFSGTVTFNKIDAATIERNNTFIPVKITKTKNDELVISPQEKYAGNSKYTLRILLSNGRKYKMDFRTKSEHRKADIEPNDDYKDASKLYLDEIIVGEITKGDKDYYEFEVPSEGEVSIDCLSLNGSDLSLSLYGEDYDKGKIKSVRSSKNNITEGLRAGKYYICIEGYYSSTYSPYELEIKFDPSPTKDDNAGNKFVDAKPIRINDSYEGNIGYKSANNFGNYSDYYEFEVPSEGEVSIDYLSLNGSDLSLSLYGEDYDKGKIKSVRSSKNNITEGLRAGKYYICIEGYYSSTYSPYELEIKFDPSPTKDDNAGNKFVDAKSIRINNTYEGNIGYKSANNFGNYSDYYEFEVPSEGEVSIDYLSLNESDLRISLYPKDYNKGRIRSVSGSKNNITEELKAGKYYICIEGYYSSIYSPYKLDLNFNR